MRLHPFNRERALRKLRFRQHREQYIKIGTIILSICILVIGIIYYSYSKYTVTKKFDIIQTKVGEFTTGDYTIASYVNGEKSSTFPTKDDGYVESKIECTNGAVGTWDYTDWSIKIKGNTSKTSCIVYFVYGYVFDYTGSVQTLNVEKDGYYKIETWGAQGGSYSDSCYGGYGGYSSGILSLSSGSDSLSIYVGGTGIGGAEHTTRYGGYNGGGNATPDSDEHTRQSSGGGATHIAQSSGLLSSLSSSKDKIIIVASGGGGGSGNAAIACAIGGSGGGISGSNGALYYESSNINGYGIGGTQTAGGGYSGSTASAGYGAFGQGGSSLFAGGGGGLYGGGCTNTTGGGGSGYIGNSLLVLSTSITKHMTCYNCTTSTDESTYTLSNTCVNSTATTDCSKQGNGYAKITYLGTTLD